VPPAEQEIRAQILEGKESRRHMKAFWIGSVSLPLIPAIRLISISLIRFSERFSVGFAVDFLLTQRCKPLTTQEFSFRTGLEILGLFVFDCGNTWC